MKEMPRVIIVIWIFLIFISIVQGFIFPTSLFAETAQIIPWPILIFMPFTMVLIALSVKSAYATTKKTENYSKSSYISFLVMLKPELLFASMCFAVGIVCALRVIQDGLPTAYLLGSGFYISSSCSFLAVYMVRCWHNPKKTIELNKIIGESKIINSAIFWKKAKRKRNIFMLVIIGWPFSAFLLSHIFIIVFSIMRIHHQIINLLVLIAWSSIFVVAWRSVTSLRCYDCQEKAFNHPFFFMKDARCRNCGVSVKTKTRNSD